MDEEFTVLIVERPGGHLGRIAAQLRHDRWTVAETELGAPAARAIARAPPDCVLVEAAGNLDVVRQLRQALGAGPAIVGVSTPAPRFTLTQLVDAGLDYVVPCPLQVAHVQAVLAALRLTRGSRRTAWHEAVR